MKLKKRNQCPFCGKQNLLQIFSRPYSDPQIKNFLYEYYKNKNIIKILKNYDYILTECVDCKFIFQKNVPDNKLSEFLYDKLISAKESLNKKKNLDTMNFEQYFKDAKIINKLCKKKNNQINILEFGSGWGYWANLMRSLNFNVETVEFSKKRSNFLKKRGIKNHLKLQSIKKKFDIIYTDQVLEHVDHPRKIIIGLKDKLKNGGFMIHKFPSTKNFKKKLKKNYKVKKDSAHPLEHINLINKESMYLLAKKLKLEPLSYIVKDFNLYENIINIKNKLSFNTVILRKN
tara:strand:+ start:13320 stop:14183 length:864 start_codon:yes stop_codon:yes gene_type:complete